MESTNTMAMIAGLGLNEIQRYRENARLADVYFASNSWNLSLERLIATLTAPVPARRPATAPSRAPQR